VGVRLDGASAPANVKTFANASGTHFAGFISLAKREIHGDHSDGVTPVPIPNTVVKPVRADGTALATGRESRSLPGISFLLSALFSASSSLGRPDQSSPAVRCCIAVTGGSAGSRSSR
jgi:hypothetical protein